MISSCACNLTEMKYPRANYNNIIVHKWTFVDCNHFFNLIHSLQCQQLKLLPKTPPPFTISSYFTATFTDEQLKICYRHSKIYTCLHTAGCKVYKWNIYKYHHFLLWRPSISINLFFERFVIESAITLALVFI